MHLWWALPFFAVLGWVSVGVQTVSLWYFAFAACVFYAVSVAGLFLSKVIDAGQVYSSVRLMSHACSVLLALPYAAAVFLAANEYATPYVTHVQAYMFWSYAFLSCMDAYAKRDESAAENAAYAIHHAVAMSLIALSVVLGRQVTGIIVIYTLSFTSVVLSVRTLVREAVSAPRGVRLALDIALLFAWFGVRMPAIYGWTVATAETYGTRSAPFACFAGIFALNIGWSFKILCILLRRMRGACTDNR